MIVHGCPNSECAIVNPLLPAPSVRSHEAVSGRMGVWPATSIYYCPPCFPLSLSRSHVSLRSLYETVHPILFPVSVQSALPPLVRPSVRLSVVRTSLSADDEMASKKRKGERTSGRDESHTALSLPLSRSLPALSSRTIAANPNVLRHLDHFKADDGRSRFCNGCRPTDALCFAVLLCPYPESERTFCYLFV